MECRPEQGNRPVIVATPSEKAIQRRISEEMDGKKEDEDISVYFDPYRGAHRPKSHAEIHQYHPNV